MDNKLCEIHGRQLERMDDKLSRLEETTSRVDGKLTGLEASVKTSLLMVERTQKTLEDQLASKNKLITYGAGILGAIALGAFGLSNILEIIGG